MFHRCSTDNLLPRERDQLVRISTNPRNNAPCVNAAVERGEYQVGDVLHAVAVTVVDDTPDGTHDGIRDGASSRVVTGIEYTRNEGDES
jgi:hypothetical protein